MMENYYENKVKNQCFQKQKAWLKSRKTRYSAQLRICTRIILSMNSRNSDK